MPDNTSSSILFDIPESSGGVNESEKILSKLCQKSYLSLWSFANLYTDEDLRDGKGSTKELCDVLVVFGDDVVIFSDKHIQFQEDKEIDISWPRWYKRAVTSSISQLYGAMNWLKRFPERVFLDAKCTRQMPVRVPVSDRARFHLVAVTRGSQDACKRFFGGGLGTPMIDTNIVGDQHNKRPFQIGVPFPAKHFVHVFDEVSLELLHRELDTIADLIAYLSAREAFLSSKVTSVTAAGEEQLLSAYLMHMNGDDHSFLPEKLTQGEPPDSINFDEGFYASLKAHPNYIAKKKADGPSYGWDWLIEKFIQLGDPGLVRPELNQPLSHIEEGLRLIAAETRFRRRILSTAIKSVFQLALTRPNARRTRIVASENVTGPLYIFLIFPKPESVDYDQYRRVRAYYLEAYCRCAKLKFAKTTTFVGMAFDHPAKTYHGSSEDLAVVQLEELSDNDRAELEKVRNELGILSDDMTMQEFHASEYPQALEFSQSANKKNQRPMVPAAIAKNQKKNRGKMVKASRKRNRK